MARPTFRCVKDLEIRYLVDAGPIVAALNERDQWHAWSVQAMSVIDEPVATSEIALAEACHLLKQDRPSLHRLIDAIISGKLIPISSWNHATRMDELIKKYPQMDAGDASLVVLSELYPKAKVITTDVRDFKVYRRFRNELIPLLHP
jgi:predicted nucleic acid-binding protein